MFQEPWLMSSSFREKAKTIFLAFIPTLYPIDVIMNTKLIGWRNQSAELDEKFILNQF